VHPERAVTRAIYRRDGHPRQIQLPVSGHACGSAVGDRVSREMSIASNGHPDHVVHDFLGISG
jgi:hypothetical protein